MDEMALHKMCEQFVYDQEYTNAMRCGPPEDWEIDLDPDDHSFAATFTRPDGKIRVQLRGVTDYYVEVASKVEEIPEGGWISRKKDAADHPIQGYGMMCLIARNAKHDTGAEFKEKEVHDDEEHYIYEWGMKEYNVTFKRG